MQNMMPQRRDDESGAISFKLPKLPKLPPISSETIANGAETLNNLVGAGTSIAK